MLLLSFVSHCQRTTIGTPSLRIGRHMNELPSVLFPLSSLLLIFAESGPDICIDYDSLPLHTLLGCLLVCFVVCLAGWLVEALPLPSAFRRPCR